MLLSEIRVYAIPNKIKNGLLYGLNYNRMTNDCIIFNITCGESYNGRAYIVMIVIINGMA